ncbi:MAG: hypothetical protein CMJ48_03555 [Planctomycetaceae bacterium]|nr:hypothetical protein [Planctomycetaceae bacterium]
MNAGKPCSFFSAAGGANDTRAGIRRYRGPHTDGYDGSNCLLSSYFRLWIDAMHRMLLLVSLLLFVALPQRFSAAQPPAWRTSRTNGATQSFQILGTGQRNNPLRRELAASPEADALYFRFRLRYDAKSIDTPAQDDGEFFVFWMDAIEGNDSSTHSGSVPNVGVHVAEGRNRFMGRFASNREAFTNTTLVGDREFLVIARLRQSPAAEGEPDAGFNRLDVWVDPLVTEVNAPQATTQSATGIPTVRWIGFSTGGKTERGDRIQVSDIAVAHTWEEILGLPTPVPPVALESEPPMRAPAPTVQFAQQVHPLLQKRCFDCHAGDDPTGEVRLDLYDELLSQVMPRDAGKSRLIQLIESADEDRMPPPDEGHPLKSQEIALLRTWIDEGVAWDERLLPSPVPQPEHWAFQPIVRPEIPNVRNAGWVRTPVDAFIAARHEGVGILPAPAASQRTLERRIALVLTGLPASNRAGSDKEDDSTDPADRVIDRLLGSQAYGEHWGRHWLDVARWGESNGHQHNRDRSHAWRYRDYVIDSFRNDKPFDQFVLEQLAGDELSYSVEGITATGFLAAARYSGNELDKEIQRNDILVDVTNTTAKAFLGLTMECAQCHGHMFDPLSTRDYYRFQAFFSRGQPGNVVLAADVTGIQELVKARWSLYDGANARLVDARRKQNYPEPILVTPKSVVGGMTRPEREHFSRLEARIAESPQVWGWYAPATAQTPLVVAPHVMRWPLPRRPETLANRKTHMLLRGDVNSRGPEVQPGWPAVFGPVSDIGPRPRTALAKWLTSPEHPLTARVFVNRIWQWHFGRGLVETSNDFGTQGAEPTHPELLDWLANELVANGWRTSHIHRLILRSNTFRQSSQFSAENQKRDPENRTLWRWRPRRLHAEAIRDSLLAAAGNLDRATGGPSVPVAESAKSRRRTVYLQVKRDALPQMQTLFDAPPAVTSCGRRRVSTVALQPLFLLNSRTLQELSAQFAERVRGVAQQPGQQVATAVEIALQRSATDEELAQGAKFLESGSLEALCLAILNVNEFLYIP